MAGNIGGNLIWRLVVVAKPNNFISAKFNIIRRSIGVHVRRDYRYVSSSKSGVMALLRIFRVIQASLSSLTKKKKEVVSGFVSKAEKEAQRVGVTLHTRSKRNISFR